MKKPLKVLVIRLSAIGDIAWTSPIIRCLKEQVEGVELHYCTKREFRYLVDSNPYIDKLHLLEGDLFALIKKLKQEKFDFVLDLHKNMRSALIRLFLWKRGASYKKLWFERFLLTHFQINKMPPGHVVDRYFKAAEALGVENDDEGMDYFISEKDEIEMDWLPEPFNKGYVAYVLGGTKFTKVLPFEKMIELCDKINRPIVLIGGKEDATIGERIEQFYARTAKSQDYEEGLLELGKKAIVFNGCGKFNISQSASLLKNAWVVFGHDTGLTHIAAAFDKVIYSIWGGTVANNFYPYGTKFYVLENADLGCRPCSKSGRDKCPKGHFKCMKENPLDFYLPDF